MDKVFSSKIRFVILSMVLYYACLVSLSVFSIVLQGGRSGLLKNESCDFLGMLSLGKEPIFGLFLIIFSVASGRDAKRN